MSVRARHHGNPDGVIHGTFVADLFANRSGDWPHRLPKIPQFVAFSLIGETPLNLNFAWDRAASDNTNIRVRTTPGSTDVEFLALCWLE